MPIYEYQCGRCSACFEARQTFADKPRAVCHLCGGESRRIFKPIPIVFKGSGFYVTDTAAEKDKKSGNGKNGDRDASSSKIAEPSKKVETVNKKEDKSSS